MSDNGAIGVIFHNVAESLSKQYYELDDDSNIKVCIGFNLVLLKDLLNLIERNDMDLYLDEGLNDITFFKNEKKEHEYLVKGLRQNISIEK